MKKVMVLLLILFELIGLSACKGQGVTGSAAFSQPQLEIIGQQREAAFKKLGIRGEMTHTPKDDFSAWELSEKVEFMDELYNVRITVDMNNDTVYGIYYYQDFVDSAEEGYNLANNLIQRLTEQNGERFAHPGEPSTEITAYRDFRALQKRGAGDFWEIWKVPDTPEGVYVILKMSFGNNDARVFVHYRYISEDLRPVKFD